jgi:hypothetical protein
MRRKALRHKKSFLDKNTVLGWFRECEHDVLHS